jgi:hypothetical protein
MKRTHITFLLGLVVLVLAFALPAVARADGSTDGWTWDGSVATSTDPAPDGWTWDEDGAAPSPDGWTWDEASSQQSAG